MNYYKMSCGHIATALSQGSPVCPVCECKLIKDIVDFDHILEDRIAICEYCGRKTDSKWSLPWFVFRPERDTDTYYCGCNARHSEE